MIRIFLAFSILFFCSVSASAAPSLLKTGPSVYQSTDGTVQIVITSVGIFAHVGPEIPLQTFNPEQLQGRDSISFFLEFDPERNIYTALYIRDRKLEITGSLTVQIAKKLRLGVDNSDLNAYASLSVEGRSVLSLAGTNVVVLSEQLAPLLEANQFKDFQGIIHPYELKSDGLFLQGKPVLSRSIGLALDQPKNRCLDAESVLYLSEEDLKVVRRKNEQSERILLLSRALKKNEDWKPLSRMIVISVQAEPGAITALDYSVGSIKQIHLLNTKAAPGGKSVCVLKSFPLN